MKTDKRILLIDFANFEDYPIGGYLTFALNMMDTFGAELALAGITTSRYDPIGKWFRKTINGVEYDFFAMARYDRARTRNIIPDRLANYLLAKYYKKRILKIGIKNIFLQRHESLIALSDKTSNICYSFPGLENPLMISKYSYAGILASWFEKMFFKKIVNAGTILAMGDYNAIMEMISRSNGALTGKTIVKFPTRIRTDIFKPIDRTEARGKLGLPADATIVLTTGRLAWLKGWKFMIDSFVKFCGSVTDPRLIFVGEGEDFEKIKLYISENKLADKIFLTGKKCRADIALYLNASDLYIMGSYKEGWPTALMEAVACGVPACATEFSSVDEIIMEGENGYILRNRSEDQFADAMLKSLKFKRPVRNEHVIRYSSDRLKDDILSYWKLT